MATVDHVADAEGMFSEINSASDSFIFRLEQCFALYMLFTLRFSGLGMVANAAVRNV